MTQAVPGTVVDEAVRARIWALLDQVCDPEIPVISLTDLGVVRDVRPGDAVGDADWEVVITPTYSGCPAMEQMADDIVTAMTAAGLVVRVRTQLAPAWSTDWITGAGRRKLREYGIAPPQARVSGVGVGEGGATSCTSPAPPASPAERVLRFLPRASTPDLVPCPRCGAQETVQVAQFGSTACKAQYRCLACREPFDYFKPL
jgi:ring-1,2-phenylacetyl-CoA epoxidase subunit PaaD